MVKGSVFQLSLLIDPLKNSHTASVSEDETIRYYLNQNIAEAERGIFQSFQCNYEFSEMPRKALESLQK